MSPEKPTPQHDDEATLVEIIRRSLADCTLTEPDAWGIAAEKLAADIALAGFEIGQHDPLDAALDLVGRRTDIVAVQLPEPLRERIWPIVIGGETETVWLNPAANEDLIVVSGTCTLDATEARNLAAALLAAAARVDAAEGEAK
ncbi:hypothetical protein [Mycolicibacterium llatzerense]|uniref:hypothetical protein n=1 Tax=Mycolicibacterium llatzerense TaxID=280871 RepID=UPI0021B55F2B|nr:hypothetical protein [Mycolicibacterium llatzerense]MCT7361207.1 hypothetical protein [Mycolicibacterium llatzerense]